MKRETKKTLVWILLIFFLCEIVKDFEFLVLKTDQTWLAENIFCKVFIILLIFFILKKLNLSWRSIGFIKSGILPGAAIGLSLGIVTFFISYSAEYLLLQGMGLNPRLSFYIASFAIDNQNITGISLWTLGVCLIGNLINVWAEEGLFRGVFLQVGKKSLSFQATNFLQAALFGLWHIIMVVIWLAEGSITVPGALVMALGYFLLAGVLGYEWGLCAALTGTIWAGFFEHFFNNFISSSLHMITETGVDELQILRIVLSNVLSLVLVIIMTRLKKSHRERAVLTDSTGNNID